MPPPDIDDSACKQHGGGQRYPEGNEPAVCLRGADGEGSIVKIPIIDLYGNHIAVECLHCGIENIAVAVGILRQITVVRKIDRAACQHIGVKRFLVLEGLSRLSVIRSYCPRLSVPSEAMESADFVVESTEDTVR